MEFDVVFQHDRACEPDPFGDLHAAASEGRQGVDGIGKSSGIERMAVAHAAEVGDADPAVGD